ncbi:MAG: hypothetical protein Q8L55_01315 [Phycisphaerales bacterium]|nr:hypothetical protein [Phycisphaerales bacterium]
MTMNRPSPGQQPAPTAPSPAAEAGALATRLAVSCYAALACAEALNYGRTHPGSRRLALALDNDTPADGYRQVLAFRQPQLKLKPPGAPM